MEKAQQVFSKFLKMNAMLGVVFLGGILAVTILDVIARSFFSLNTIKGATELSSNLLMSMILLGFGWCAYEGSNISVDILKKLVAKSRTLDYFLTTLNNVITAIIAYFAAIQAYHSAIYHMERNMTTWILRWPFYPFYLITAYGFLLLFAAIIFRQLNIKNTLAAEDEETDLTEIKKLSPL